MTRRARALLVDDRDDVRSMLRDVLTGFDCVFTEAENGTRALELIAFNAFDVIILDYKLPDMSGTDVLVEARKRELAFGKIIVVTGYPDLNIEKEAYELGAFRFLSKGSWTRLIIRRTFREALGIAPPPVVTSAARRRDRASTKGDPRPSLLLVDSDPSSLEEMLEILSEEFAPIPARGADDALKKVGRRAPALVILDVNLPGQVSGLEVLTRMRKSVPDLRAIMISEEHDPDAAFESAQRGALKYVLKSRLTSLPVTIRRILNDQRPATRVFLCHAGADIVRVLPFYNKLLKRGFLPWIDARSLRGGRDWQAEIEKAIEETHYFVFFVSKNSVGREGVMRREVKLALRRQSVLEDEKVDGATFFIPARLEDCPVDPSIQRFHHIDLFKRNEFQKLIRELSS